MRPPPAGTPAQSARTSPPQAERSTNNSSRGRIGRSASAGAAAGVAAAAAGAAPAGAWPPPPAALTACWQPADSFALLVSRQFNAAAPPVGTPAQPFR